MRILPSDGSYKTFCDMVTGYRTLSVVIQAVSSGIIDIVGNKRCTIDQLLETIEMNKDEGRRFVSALVDIGMLENHEEQLHLSRFARKYLLRGSELSQRNVLEFENRLMDKWRGLGDVLSKGQQSQVTDQPQDEYRERLSLYQKAMSEAALVRSKELWDAIPCLPETGMIIDCGAGDGTYLKEFLKRYPGWNAVACDLPDVIAIHGSGCEESGITTHPCNLADMDECNDFVAQMRGCASILLLSNFIHCYSEPEIRGIICRLKHLLKEDARVSIHDFFRDGNSFGSLYDLHMMVNTYNGRTYTIDETTSMLQDSGFKRCDLIELPSYSHAIIAQRE